MNDTALPHGPLPPRRSEDERLITGRGQFVDDVRLPADRPAMLHVAFARSPYAHAAITGVHLDQARAHAAVVAAMSGADLQHALRPLESAMPLPGLKQSERWPLAVGKTRYVGDPVAVILAESAESAENACDLVEVDYVPLPAAVDVEVVAGLCPANCRTRSSVGDGVGRDPLAAQSAGSERHWRSWRHRGSASDCECRARRAGAAGCHCPRHAAYTAESVVSHHRGGACGNDGRR